VSSGGIVAEGLAVQGDMITGKFGVFYGGLLQAVYIDRTGKQIGMQNIGEVSPLTEIIISRPLSDISSFCEGVRYQVQSYDKKVIGLLDELKFKK
jgi:hypothetical protein